jgi:hypothetical protein
MIEQLEIAGQGSFKHQFNAIEHRGFCRRASSKMNFNPSTWRNWVVSTTCYIVVSGPKYSLAQWVRSSDHPSRARSD